jgi:hypothetical protein
MPEGETVEGECRRAVRVQALEGCALAGREPLGIDLRSDSPDDVR